VEKQLDLTPRQLVLLDTETGLEVTATWLDAADLADQVEVSLDDTTWGRLVETARDNDEGDYVEVRTTADAARLDPCDSVWVRTPRS